MGAHGSRHYKPISGQSVQFVHLCCFTKQYVVFLAIGDHVNPIQRKILPTADLLVRCEQSDDTTVRCTGFYTYPVSAADPKVAGSNFGRCSRISMEAKCLRFVYLDLGAR